MMVATELRVTIIEASETEFSRMLARMHRAWGLPPHVYDNGDLSLIRLGAAVGAALIEEHGKEKALAIFKEFDSLMQLLDAEETGGKKN